MKKLICAAAVSAAICAPIAANAFSDVMDPAYETKELLENYRISEQKSNEIVFKNTKAPSSEVKIKFVKLGDRRVTDVLLDHIYSSYRNQQLNHCQSDELLTGMGAFEFTCINNQSNIVHFAVTGFANSDGSPKSFVRIVDSSAVSGDNAPAEDLAELINFANFKLGYFEEAENGEAATLKHATMRELHDIDLSGVENMVYEAANFWNGKKPSAPVSLENIDVSDKGIKYFLRTSENKPLYAVIHLDERRDISMLIKESLELSNRGCDKPQMASSPFGSDVDAFRVSCSDAIYGTYFKELKLKKDKLNSYLILTGEEKTAVNLGTMGFNQLVLYLYEDFFNREIMLSRDNIFAYMEDIDSGRLQPVSKAYMTDTKKAKDERSESEDKAVFTVGNTESDAAVSSGDDGMLIPLIGILIVLLGGGAGAFVYMQKKKANSSTNKKDKEEPVHETSDGTEMDLTAEIQAAQMEKARREREIQKQRREAELIAQKLEEARKNESPEERRKRLEEIEKQNEEDLARALSQPKETVAAANIEAQKQMKQMQESGAMNSEKPASSTEENTKPGDPVAEEPKPKKQAASAEEFEEQLQQELKAEADRRKKEEPVKLKGSALLAKMNQSRDDSAKNDSSIPDAKASSSQTVALSKKDDSDRPVLRMVKEDKKPEPDAKPEKSQLAAPTKMSDLSALGSADAASKASDEESMQVSDISDTEPDTISMDIPQEENISKPSAFNSIPGFETVDAEPAREASEKEPATPLHTQVHTSFASIPGMETVDSNDSATINEQPAPVKTLSSVAPSSFSSIPGMETVEAVSAAEEEKPITAKAEAPSAPENGVKKKAKNPFDAIVKTGKGTAKPMTEDQALNTESSKVNPEPEPEPETKPAAKKTTRKIRKFNMGSLSISIKNPDNE